MSVSSINTHTNEGGCGWLSCVWKVSLVMEVEESAPLLASNKPMVLAKGSRSSAALRRLGSEAKGLLGLQGNAADSAGKVRVQCIVHVFYV